MTERVYIVLETSFLDDYKSRGNDWSTTKVHVFSTIEKAEAFVMRKEKSYCMSFFEEDPANMQDYIDKGYLDHSSGELKDDVVDDLFYELTKGEYVQSTYVLEIDEQFIDSNDVEAEPATKRRLIYAKEDSSSSSSSSFSEEEEEK